MFACSERSAEAGPTTGAQVAQAACERADAQQGAEASQHPKAGNTTSVRDCQASITAASHLNTLMRRLITSTMYCNPPIPRLPGGVCCKGCRLFNMARWLVVLLMVLLPLQLSWAAVAPYCSHEPGSQPQHPGHHEHPHTVTANLNENTAPEPGALAGVDLDCGYCHGTCAGMPAPDDRIAQPTQSARPVTAVQGRLRTRIQSPPDRPQWAPLA